MRNPKTIVVATDFSACSLCALEQAGRMASRYSAALFVIHVVDSEALEGLASVVPFSRAELKAQLADQATARLGEAVAETLDGATVELLVRVGHPLKTILSTVQDLAADLLVVGAYGEEGAGHGAGMVATECARSCSASVLLVDDAQAHPAQTVIACVDFSPETNDVVAAAAAMAAVDGARLVLLHVHHNPFDVLRWRNPLVDTSGQYGEYVATLGGQLERIRDRVRALHDTLTIECELRFGIDYGRSIVAHIKELDAALAVLGAKVRTKLAYALLGSTPEKVLRETASSVLIARSPLATTKD